MKSLNTDSTNAKVLIIEDDESLKSSLALNLELHGFLVKACADAKSACSLLESDDYDLIVCDLLLQDIEATSFVEHCKRIAPDTAIIITSGMGRSEQALAAIKAGADDFLPKPFAPDVLLFTIHKILLQSQGHTSARHKESDRCDQQDRTVSEKRLAGGSIVAESPAMLEIFQTVNRLSSFNTTVLIVGESGTGKELLARAIHSNSPRRGMPFVPINCGAIPELLMESELFGHKKGSFTDAIRDKAGLFEEANGGTIFLDEIGELPVHLQVKLLRALQEQQIRRVGDDQLIDIDVRVIAATLRNLEQDVANGRFRDDLYYRLNVVTVVIPPLRERVEDIPVLVKHFIKKHCKKLGLTAKKIDKEALDLLLRYQWRGNVRELENCIERALVLSETDVITADSLPEQLHFLPETSEEIANISKVSADCLSIKQRTRELETGLILKALAKTHGNRTHAAKILEISHRALLYKIKEYGL